MTGGGGASAARRPERFEGGVRVLSDAALADLPNARSARAALVTSSSTPPASHLQGRASW